MSSDAPSVCPTMIKYPRTPHLQGSRLQPGDHDLNAVAFSEIVDCHLVVEEKVDGANSGVRFDEHGRMWLQSRGHFLQGGAREKHFALFKQWAEAARPALHAALGARYSLYGEWLYAKHTVFYDQLPHYFLEYDVLDTATGHFLSTDRRKELLAGAPISSVPVLASGKLESLAALTRLVGPSHFKSEDWRAKLVEAGRRAGLDATRVSRETDESGDMEGLYIKHEEEGRVVGRYKWIRATFVTAVVDSGTHWLNRPIVQNGLAPGREVFDVC
jgi:hypothetical protein